MMDITDLELEELDEFINMLSDIPELQSDNSIIDVHNQLVPEKSNRIIKYSEIKSTCICCYENRYTIDINLYYDTNISDKNIKLCLCCAQKIYLDKISKSRSNSSLKLFTNRKVKVFSYSGTSINTSLNEPICIIPAIIGSNIRYICLYSSLIKALVNKQIKCIHCDTNNKNKAVNIYNTEFYICYTCYKICRSVKDIDHDIIIDYHRPDMYCYKHRHNKSWVYVSIIIKKNQYIVIPICYGCYLLLDRMPTNIFL